MAASGQSYFVHNKTCRASSSDNPILQVSDLGDLQIIQRKRIFWFYRVLSPLGGFRTEVGRPPYNYIRSPQLRAATTYHGNVNTLYFRQVNATDVGMVVNLGLVNENEVYPSNLDGEIPIPRVIWQIRNSGLAMTLRVSNDCQLRVLEGNTSEGVARWGKACDSEAPGVPSLSLTQDSSLLLRDKSGEVNWELNLLK